MALAVEKAIATPQEAADIDVEEEAYMNYGELDGEIDASEIDLLFDGKTASEKCLHIDTTLISKIYTHCQI